MTFQGLGGTRLALDCHRRGAKSIPQQPEGQRCPFLALAAPLGREGGLQAAVAVLRSN